MIIVKVVGGLGNQLFCYAYAKALENQGHQVKIDISGFRNYHLHGGYQLDKYFIDLQPTNNIENQRFYSRNFLFKVLKRLKIDFANIIKEKSLLFDQSLLELDDDVYVEGYFQTEKYFSNIKDILVNQFTFKYPFSSYTKLIEQKISGKQNACSVHIRRGDFLHNQNVNIHGACTIDYYHKAFHFLKRKVGELNYFIFSDDIEWCRYNLNVENATFVESKENRLPHEDLFLMSKCEHNIIANSSFSWWGAWLNNNQDKVVVAPKMWFSNGSLDNESSDIVCEDWIRL